MDKETLAATFFVLSVVAFATVALGTPAGGWNPNNVLLYQPWYKPAFGITGAMVVVATIVLHKVFTSNSK
jgi:hypothetical protein